LRQEIEYLQEENRRLKGTLAEHNRMQSDLKDSIDELIQVHRYSQIITSTLNLDDVLLSLMELVRQVVEYRVSGVFLIEEGKAGLKLISPRPIPKELEEKVRFQWEEGIIDWVLQEGRPVVFPDVEPTEGSEEHRDGRNFIVAPLLAKGKDLGVLILYSTKPRGAFTRQEIRLVSILSNQAAIAIENSRLYNRLEDAHTRLKASQRQLIQSGKLAAIGELASGMAHEINNPLQIILSTVQLMIMNLREDERSIKALKIVERNARRIAKITGALLDFARKNDVESITSSMDVSTLIRRIQSLVQYQLQAADIRLRVIAEENLPPISGNAGQLEQAFLSIIFNARDAMPEGGELVIEIKRWGDYLRIDFVDTGVGIPEENLSRIFEPFFTTHGERCKGLGLSVSYGIIQRHGGTIEVESLIGHGSRFIVKLPVRR